MADNEKEEPLEDVSLDEDDSEVAKSKGLSKSTLIKIAIGIVSLLIIAGGAYFFFMSSEEPIQEETSVESTEEIPPSKLEAPNPIPGEDNEVAPLPTDEMELPVIEEPTIENPMTEPTIQNPVEDKAAEIEAPVINTKAATEQIELIRMREEALALKEENLRMRERLVELEAQKNVDAETSTPEGTIKTTEGDVAPKPKVKKSQYSNLYTRDYAPVVRQTNPEPPPEPKWGNFDPLYRAK